MEGFKFVPNINNGEKIYISKDIDKLQNKLTEVDKSLFCANKDYNEYMSLKSSREDDAYPKLAKEFIKKILTEKEKIEMEIDKKKLSSLDNIGMN